MSPLRAIAFVPVAAVLFAQLSCSSSTKTVTSGGAHFELVSDATADPSLRCDDIGKQVTISVKDDKGQDKLIVDGADGATVQCQFDSTHFVVTVSNDAGSVSASGQIAAGKSTNTSVTIGLLGSAYNSPAATPCTVVFCDATGCGSPTLPTGSSIEGHFLCNEIDNTRTAKECSVTGANPAGISNSYFKFNDCTGF